MLVSTLDLVLSTLDSRLSTITQTPSASEPVRVSINKLYLVPKWTSWPVLLVCSETAVTDHLLHRSSCFFEVDRFPVSCIHRPNPVDHAVLFIWVGVVLWSREL